MGWPETRAAAPGVGRPSFTVEVLWTRLPVSILYSDVMWTALPVSAACAPYRRCGATGDQCPLPMLQCQYGQWVCCLCRLCSKLVWFVGSSRCHLAGSPAVDVDGCLFFLSCAMAHRGGPAQIAASLAFVVGFWRMYTAFQSRLQALSSQACATAHSVPAHEYGGAQFNAPSPPGESFS